MIDLWQYIDYKEYLSAYMEAGQSQGRGLRSKLAAAIGCQLAYLSQVMRHAAHLNLEQALRASAFLQHDDQTTRYFLLLVELARAGSTELRRHFEAQIHELTQQRAQLKERFRTRPQFSVEQQAHYFSVWYIAAVHVLLTCPAFRTRETVAARLGLGARQTQSALDFLVSTGLAVEDGGVYTSRQTTFHLPQGAPALAHHHANWRLRALAAIEKNDPDNLHYSSVVSVSREDFSRIREMLLDSIAQVKKVVAPSKEEDVVSFNVDCFTL